MLKHVYAVGNLNLSAFDFISTFTIYRFGSNPEKPLFKKYFIIYTLAGTLEHDVTKNKNYSISYWLNSYSTYHKY